MQKELWNELNEILAGDREELTMELAVNKLLPYIKKCSTNNYQKAKSYNLNIPYEDFYSNSLFEVWEGLKAFVNDNTLNLKNIIIYRLNIAEKKTWRQYKKNGHSYDSNQITYNSARWTEIDFDIQDNFNFENHLIIKRLFEQSLLQYTTIDKEKAIVISLLSKGYSSKEAFNIAYQTNDYNPKDRKKIERIKKQFIDLYFNSQF